MASIDEDKAQERIQEIAGKHNLNPEILKDVLKGRSEGLTHEDISEKYEINKNTVSKYNRKIEEEFSEEDLGDLLLIIGVLLGGAYLLDRILNN
jgi:Fic family protein